MLIEAQELHINLFGEQKSAFNLLIKSLSIICFLGFSRPTDSRAKPQQR